MLSQKEDEALTKLSSLLGANKKDLYDVIQFESRWDPKSTNEKGSGARGLIQFMPSTARGLKYVDESGNVRSYSSSDDLVAKNPTIEDQLRVVNPNKLSDPKNGPVAQYFASNLARVSNPSIYDIAASVFMPAAVGKPDADLASMLSGKAKERFPSQNPGIYTMRDYVAKVMKLGGGGYKPPPTMTASAIKTAVQSVPAAVSVASVVGNAINSMSSENDGPKRQTIKEVISVDEDKLKNHLELIKKSIAV